MATYPMDAGAKRAFDIARDTAKKYSNKYTGTEHLLYGILKTECYTAKLFVSNGLDPDAMLPVFESEEEKVSALPVDSQKIEEIPFAAYSIAMQFGAPLISADHLMLAILDYPTCVATEVLYGEFKVNVLALRRNIQLLIRQNGSLTTDTASGDQGKQSLPSQLADLGVDVTQRARDNKLDPVIGREHEVERIIEILCRKTKNNPVLIGEPGVGKSAIVDGLARAIVDGKVPRQLQNNIVFSLNIGSLMAGTKYRGQLEEKLKDAIDLIINSGNIIVFIDELHTLMQAGSKDGEVTPADILKPYLARGELHTVGATTTDEYRKYIEADKAMERRFQPITVEPPTVEQTIEILKGLRPNYENYHKVKLSDEAIVAAAKLSDKYISDRFLPDKAIDLIDEAMSCAKVSASTDPEDVNGLSEQLAEAKRKMSECAARQEFAQAESYKQKCAEIEKQIRDRTMQNAAEREKSSMTIYADAIADIVSRWTKIPVSKLTETESERLRNMEDILHKRVIGQHKAVEAVSKAIRRARAGLKSDSRPIGSFIFLGPTGVGKTELTKALAEAMFDNENSIIRLDMSEFMESHSVSKLIGAPPGYVGFDDGGQLTEKVRRHPYSVVLFDEIEKAHPDVFNILLQILDDGRVTDSQGRTVDFKNTIIIMTSNLGANVILDSVGADGRISEQTSQEVNRLLRATFRPELLNRIDEIITFNPLTKDEVKRIVDLMLENVTKRLSDKQLKLEVSPLAKDYIVDNGYDVSFGARPLKRFIQHNVETAIAKSILSGNVKPNSTLVVDVKDNELTIGIK